MEKASLDQGKQVLALLSGSTVPEVQNLINAGDLLKMLMQAPDIGSVDRAKFRDLLNINPFSFVSPSRDYPRGWKMRSWEEQLKALFAAEPFSGLSTDGLQEMAEGYLAAEALWQQMFTFSLSDQQVLLWDGLIVFVLPGKYWKKREKNDLWADVAKAANGKGYWGALMEKILFPALRKVEGYKNFYNFREDAMGSDRFLPLDSVASWLQELESKITGDFAVCPYNAGRRFAGHSVASARFIADNELHCALTPSWINGQMLLTNPKRLTVDDLLIDCGGDQYRFGDDSEFLNAPYFYHGGYRPGFRTRKVAGADSYFGSPFAAR